MLDMSILVQKTYPITSANSIIIIPSFIIPGLFNIVFDKYLFSNTVNYFEKIIDILKSKL